ncbi:CGNR zinc finger domain-containing protein [Streptomyces sp. 8L]|uniref:CGNR zinc finger domain-containing protein n=1 Tax=Streptomyces sp. 8L TaxID=2877242 RepID=UPI001CD41A7E|nr:CGNR zinc finger domain-containing protein [Streptomyces sp. 8L]MCA1223183.1 CGNR zinc finger domain-containing protein [Streptomyces sp. 8L]
MDDDSALLMDLLNTTPVVEGVPADRLAGDDAARAWIVEHGGRADQGAPERLRELRGLLQAVVRGERDPEALGPFLEGVVKRPAVGRDGVAWRLDVAGDRALTVRAVLAWAELAERLPGRVRPCANPECRLFLLDRSRAGTARWCSMATCGNRLKARRHQARRATGSGGSAAG